VRFAQIEPGGDLPPIAVHRSGRRDRSPARRRAGDRRIVITAHLIVGRKLEPYLEAALASIADACAHAVVNDNSGASDGPNSRVLSTSRFAVEDRLTIVRSAFTDFAAARNLCIDATPAALHAGWALRLDSDEVFDDGIGSLVARLPTVPRDIDVIDGYSTHFVGSFDYFDSVARQLLLFRLDRNLRWTLPVHERLEPVRRRAALPIMLHHYGHVVPARVEQARGELYTSLGQRVEGGRDFRRHATAREMWGRLLRRAIRFRGTHPLAVRPVIARLSAEWADDFAQVDDVVAGLSPIRQLGNALRNWNYRRLLVTRGIEARIRWGM